MDFYFLLKIWIKLLVKIKRNLGGKYSQQLLDHAKQPAADAPKTTSKRVIQKTAEWTGDLIGNQISTRVFY